MTDLTKITTPFGLLDPETQDALKAHGGPYQHYWYGEWTDDNDAARQAINGNDHWIIRVKPAKPPRKPREWWIFQNTTDRATFSIVTFARTAAQDLQHPCEIIHVREVLE